MPTTLSLMRQDIKSVTWEENDARTDAHLAVEISPFYGDKDPDPVVRDYMKLWNKKQFIELVESVASERADSFYIDSILITMDGDTEDTTVRIVADIDIAP